MKKLENKAEYLPLSELVKLENNPRTIKKADRQMLESHEEVLVFTNADSLKELQASFPEIGAKNA